jgi:hypothetical protein
MAYVGRGLNQTGGQYRKLDDISSEFDGDATGFSLTVDDLEVTPTAQNLMISINGVIQDPGTAFSIVGSTITFTGAPAAGSDFFGVVMGEASYIAYGSVGANEVGVTAGAVSASKGIVADSSKNLQGINQVTASSFKGDGTGITGVTAEWDGTHTGNGVITGDFDVSGDISGSSTSTGSFAHLEAVVLSSDFGTKISGSFTTVSSSLASRLTNTTASISGLVTDSGSFSTRVTQATASIAFATSSISALKTDSGSFSTRATQVTASISAATSSISALKTDSGSFSTRVTTVEGSGTIQGVGTTNAVTFATVDTGQGANELYDMDQNVLTTSSPTFADLTATGTVTAQEFHTEFVSASIIYQSGSTKFGDTTDDIHQFTGSLAVTGSNLTITTGGNVSGSVTSTGSFGRVEATRLSGDGTDITGLSSFAGAAGTEALISGSSTSTGSFGSVHTAGYVGIGTASPTVPLTSTNTNATGVAFSLPHFTVQQKNYDWSGEPAGDGEWSDSDYKSIQAWNEYNGGFFTLYTKSGGGGTRSYGRSVQPFVMSGGGDNALSYTAWNATGFTQAKSGASPDPNWRLSGGYLQGRPAEHDWGSASGEATWYITCWGKCGTFQ